MADHVREQIVVAAVAAVTGLATTGSNVFRDRDTDERPLQATELPALLVDDDGDPAEIISIGQGRLLERTMRIRITAFVKSASGYSTLLNTILKEIEIAIAGAALGGAKYALLALVDPREVDESGEKSAVRQAFHFDFYYVTAHNAPDVAL